MAYSMLSPANAGYNSLNDSQYRVSDFESSTQASRFDSNASSDHEQRPHSLDGLQKSRPPPIHYSLHTRKTSIAITWGVILTTSCLCPVILYYTLTHVTTLKLKDIFAIISGLTAVALVDFVLRFWKLLQPRDEYRPLGAGRWAIDFFQIEFAANAVAITLFQAIGTAKTSLHLLALSAPVLLTVVAGQMLLLAWPAAKGVSVPFRISSQPAGAPLRPVAYIIMEDVVAVNGGGGKEYRTALNKRWEHSPVFRQLVTEVSLAWGVTGTTVGVVCLVLIGTIDIEIAYGIAWVVPWIYAGLASVVTIWWARKRLADERSYYANLEA